VGLAAQRLAGLDEVIDAARSLGKVGAIDLVDAMGNPTHHQSLGPGVPQRTVDLEILGVDRIQLFGGRRRFHQNIQGGG
jgi:hypothetical protein